MKTTSRSKKLRPLWKIDANDDIGQADKIDAEDDCYDIWLGGATNTVETEEAWPPILHSFDRSFSPAGILYL